MLVTLKEILFPIELQTRFINVPKKRSSRGKDDLGLVNNEKE